MTRQSRIAEAFSLLDCAQCGSRSGDPCRTPGGSTTKPHKGREVSTNALLNEIAFEDAKRRAQVKTHNELLAELEKATEESMLVYIQARFEDWIASDEWQRFCEASDSCNIAGVDRDETKATLMRAEAWAIREANGENDGYYNK